MIAKEVLRGGGGAVEPVAVGPGSEEDEADVTADLYGKFMMSVGNNHEK